MQAGSLIPERKLPAQEVRDAIWSIYLHATFRNGLKRPVLVGDERLEPQPLRAAVDTLAEGRRAGEARQSRALRKLVASGLFRTERLVTLLGEEEGRRTRHSIETLAHRLHVKLNRLDPLPPPAALRTLLSMLQDSAPFVGECAIADPWCVSCHDGLTLDTTVRGRIRVNRTPDQLAPFVDPRAWDDCHLFFLDAYRTNDVPAGGVWPPHPQNSTTSHGTPWTGYVFEKVQAGPVIFENVLEVTDFVRSANLVYLRYKEHLSWKTHFPTATINGGIEIDDGWTRVSSLGASGSRVSIKKTVRFVDLTPGPGTSIDYGELLNYWVPAMLCLWVDEEIEISPCCGTA